MCVCVWRVGVRVLARDMKHHPTQADLIPTIQHQFNSTATKPMAMDRGGISHAPIFVIESHICAIEAQRWGLESHASASTRVIDPRIPVHSAARASLQQGSTSYPLAADVADALPPPQDLLPSVRKEPTGAA